MKRKCLSNGIKGFTLIELIAVLVIMAIIALIVTPLVMNIIRKARISADKRSVDAYGRSIELAIAGYLLENGDFPTSINDLTIEYSGDEVVCTTTELNDDSSLYLTGCTVDGRTVDYEYHTLRRTHVAPSYTTYSIGDHVSYNGVTYYVIEDSNATSDTVKLLKENALTKAEIDALNLTGVTASEGQNGYGQVRFGSSNDYSTSTVKQVVDAWKATAIKSGDTAIARLITHEDLVNNLGYIDGQDTTKTVASSDGETPTWVYNSNYWYWTSSRYTDNSSHLWFVGNTGFLGSCDYGAYGVVRPVIEISKSAQITKLSQ